MGLFEAKHAARDYIGLPIRSTDLKAHILPTDEAHQFMNTETVRQTHYTSFLAVPRPNVYTGGHATFGLTIGEGKDKEKEEININVNPNQAHTNLAYLYVTDSEKTGLTFDIASSENRSLIVRQSDETKPLEFSHTPQQIIPICPTREISPKTIRTMIIINGNTSQDQPYMMEIIIPPPSFTCHITETEMGKPWFLVRVIKT